MNGVVSGIFICSEGSEAMREVSSAIAVAGKGLDGDRYFLGTGTYSNAQRPDREITLIESEAIDALERESSIKIALRDSRRNIVTSGVALNHLVDREFRVGEATLRGIRLCEPCNHLESLTKGGVRAGLVHRGGLRAQIVTGGEIKTGDSVSIND